MNREYRFHLSINPAFKARALVGVIIDQAHADQPSVEFIDLSSCVWHLGASYFLERKEEETVDEVAQAANLSLAKSGLGWSIECQADY
jgi:hypothetical protein